MTIKSDIVQKKDLTSVINFESLLTYICSSDFGNWKEKKLLNFIAVLYLQSTVSNNATH